MKDLIEFVTDFKTPLLVIIFLTILMIFGAKEIEETTCYQYGINTQREVKFVKYTFINWECLTKTNEGKWIGIKNLREF